MDNKDRQSLPNNVVPLVWTGTSEVVQLFLSLCKVICFENLKREHFERIFFFQSQLLNYVVPFIADALLRFRPLHACAAL